MQLYFLRHADAFPKGPKRITDQTHVMRKGLLLIAIFVSAINSVAEDSVVRHILSSSPGALYKYITREDSLTVVQVYLSSPDTAELLEILPLPWTIPPGATMPEAVGYGSISTTFTWIPSYCQSGVDTVWVDYLTDNTPLGTDLLEFTVNNYNRTPKFSLNDTILSCNIGRTFSFDIAAVDLDQLECADDTIDVLFQMQSSITPSLEYQGGNVWSFSWMPSPADWDSNYATFIVSDQYSAQDTSTILFDIYYCGDANHNASVALSDVIYMVNKIFNKPGNWDINPPVAADVNGDERLTLSDVIYLVNNIFNKPGDWSLKCGE